MENIREQYSFPIEEAVIVENVDNCIDESYHTVRFDLNGDELDIMMLGDGMDPAVFWKILTKIAATTKFEDRRGSSLGRYGWGMKISMCVADYVTIETRLNDFHGAQSWKLINEIPNRKKEQPSVALGENFTFIKVKLKCEYKQIFTRELIERTLQKFYPTLLAGAKISNGHGRKRELRIMINSDPVQPPQEVRYVKKKPLAVRVDGKEATGYVFLAEESVARDDQGIKIIVNGRKITEEFFGVFGSENERITGYFHADALIEDLAGDKTSIKRNTSRWRKLSEGVGKQLSDFMKEIGATREEQLPRSMVTEIHLEINNLLKHFPELQELAKRAGISFYGDVLVPKQQGDIMTKLEEGSERQPGTESGGGGGSGVPVSSGDDTNVAPSKESGQSSATKKKRKRGLNIWPRPEPNIRKEAWFSPGEGMVIVNSMFPTYKKAEKMRSLRYHMVRCAIEALLNRASEIGLIEREKLIEYRDDVLAKWGTL
jgi:hypothetical protein